MAARSHPQLDASLAVAMALSTSVVSVQLLTARHACCPTCRSQIQATTVTQLTPNFGLMGVISKLEEHGTLQFQQPTAGIAGDQQTCLGSNRSLYQTDHSGVRGPLSLLCLVQLVTCRSTCSTVPQHATRISRCFKAKGDQVRLQLHLVLSAGTRFRWAAQATWIACCLACQRRHPVDTSSCLYHEQHFSN